ARTRPEGSATGLPSSTNSLTWPTATAWALTGQAMKNTVGKTNPTPILRGARGLGLSLPTLQERTVDNEIQLISDGDGLAVIGDRAAVERFLVFEGLSS